MVNGSRCVDFQLNLKAKREKSSFGSKEGLMQIGSSGLKSKERGLKIFRGIVRHPDKSEAKPGTNISTSSKCPVSVKANRTDLAPIYSQNSSHFSRWDRCREAHPSIICPGHFIAVENVFKRTGILGSASMPKQRDGHGWYCQQEGDQDGCEKGMGPLFL
jgi:hypothetical protein